jgi:hypothetical protein
MKSLTILIVLLAFNLNLLAQVSFKPSSTNVVGNIPRGVTAADVNGDGKVDLITANVEDGTLTVLTNNGHGGFVIASSPRTGNGAYAVTTADIFGNGGVELVCVNNNDNTMTICTNAGNGVFGAFSTQPVGNGAFGVTAADVNGDGKVDILSANYNDGTVTVLTNAGGGKFVVAASPSVGANPWAVTVANLNLDGKPDLICPSLSGNIITVLTNLGGGNFAPAFTLPTGRAPTAIVATDVNGDGSVDLVVDNSYDSTLSVYTNNGHGVFTLSSTPNIGGNPWNLTSADVNGDGRPDMITANNTSGTLTVMTNTGNGTFVQATTVMVGGLPPWVTTADVNGDGKPDLIGINNNANSLYIFTNATPYNAIPTNAPQITVQPLGQTNLVGGSASFSVNATDGPNGLAVGLGYQWQFNGTNLPAATNSILSLNNLTLAQAGAYGVVVSNVVGRVTSGSANLAVSFILANVNGQPALGTATFVGSSTVSLSGGYPGGFLFYTLDGSTPTVGSTLYTQPFTVTNSAFLQVIGLSSDFSQQSSVYSVTLESVPVYTLQTSVAGSGTISINPASGPYASNSIVTLTATAATNWAFAYWTGAASGSQNPLPLTINASTSVQAFFVPTAFPLTLGTLGGGSVLANGLAIAPATYYPANSTVFLSATASNGWSFLDWQGNAGGTNDPLNLTVTQADNVTAVFGSPVTNKTVGGGAVILSQPNPIAYGANVFAAAVPSNGNYFVTWSGAASGTNTPYALTVTNTGLGVNALFAPLPSGKYSLSVVIAGNGSVTQVPYQNSYNYGQQVSLSASSGNTNANFSWSGAVSATNSSLILTVTSNLVVQANFGSAPSVTISPLSLTVVAGGNAVLTASAAGLPPFAYQWQDSEGAIPGQTNATLTITDVQTNNADNYSVVVTNSFGAVTSAVATVTVVLPPTIELSPLSQNVAAGTSLTLGVLAGGTAPLAYQWQNSSGPIAGATNSSLTYDLSQTNETDAYSVVVSNSYGVVTSAVAEVVVYLPVTIQAQPASQVVAASAPASFTVTASGFPAPNSWQWSLNGTNLAGATASSLTIPRVGLANLGNYQVTVGNGYSTVASVPAALDMTPSLVSAFGGATTIWGTSATLSVGAIGSGLLNYQWYQNGVAINGANGSTLNFPSIQFTNAGLYYVVVTSPYGSVTNTAAEVVVNPAGVSIGFCPALTLSGVVGQSYIIQSSSDLANTNAWVTVTNLILSQPVQLWVDTNVDVTSPLNPKYFYRVLPGN